MTLCSELSSVLKVTRGFVSTYILEIWLQSLKARHVLYTTCGLQISFAFIMNSVQGAIIKTCILNCFISYVFTNSNHNRLISF